MSPPVAVSPGAPPGFEVFTHIKFAGHSFTLDFPCEGKGKRISDRAFRQTAVQLNRVAIYGAVKIARNKLAAMYPLDAVPSLVEQEGVFTGAGTKIDMNIPKASQVGNRSLR